jgi:hypothetical protein
VLVVVTVAVAVGVSVVAVAVGVPVVTVTTGVSVVGIAVSVGGVEVSSGGGVVADTITVAEGVTAVADGEATVAGGAAVSVGGGASVEDGVALGSSTTNGGKTNPLSAMGVRYVFCQENGVNIAILNNGCRIVCCPPAVSTSKLEPMPTFNIHWGMTRMANCPAININKMPSGTIKMRRLQSRRSRSDIFMALSPWAFQQAM